MTGPGRRFDPSELQRRRRRVRRTPSTPSSWPRRASSRPWRRATRSCRPPASRTASWPPSPPRRRRGCRRVRRRDPRPARRRFAAALRDGVAGRDGRRPPVVVRAQALAFVLLVVLAVGSLASRRGDRGGEPADPAVESDAEGRAHQDRATDADGHAARCARDDAAGRWACCHRDARGHRDTRAQRVAGGIRRPRDGRTQDAEADPGPRNETPRPTRTPRAEETPEPTESEEPDEHRRIRGRWRERQRQQRSRRERPRLTRRRPPALGWTGDRRRRASPVHRGAAGIAPRPPPTPAGAVQFVARIADDAAGDRHGPRARRRAGRPRRHAAPATARARRSRRPTSTSPSATSPTSASSCCPTPTTRLLRVGADAAGWSRGSLVVIVPTGSVPPAGVPGPRSSSRRPPRTRTGPSRSLVGDLAARLDARCRPRGGVRGHDGRPVGLDARRRRRTGAVRGLAGTAPSAAFSRTASSVGWSGSASGRLDGQRLDELRSVAADVVDVRGTG